ncbi:MAG: glycosyltransferase [Acidimicrobiia bacterium]|nr:glycosyltransferase [Acidimicrobiia bacterium]
MAEPFSSLRYLAAAARLAVNALREGRLSASPARWLLDLRHLHGVMRTGAEPAAMPAARPRQDARAALDGFLRDGSELQFDTPPDPLVSVLLVLHNRAELTLRCLQSLAADRSFPLELVIVDNASSDATRGLLERVRGANILRSPENVGFLLACNRAARTARGRYLLFLNNDAELQPGSLAAALETITRDASIGAVGGRLVFPDGRLQEAGSLIRDDGSCAGYGRGDVPWKPEYSFQRDVDFCSAAFLLTPRRLFTELGGFDDRYAPAYYEDADYCVRLWKTGRRVVYEPRAVVTHVEFGSGSPAAAEALQRERRAMFVDAHREWLTRTRPHAAPRLIFVEDRVPHPRLGSGYPRALTIVQTARELGYRVTVYPLQVPNEDWSEAYSDMPRDVELMLGAGREGLLGFLAERLPHCDVLLVSRPHNMRLVGSALPALPADSRPPLIYDAEAIFALRDIGRQKLLGQPMTDTDARQLVAEELALAAGSDLVLAVSDLERQPFLDSGVPCVYTLGYGLVANPTPSPFASRDGFLFVGAITTDSPNADSMRWLANEILPRLTERLGHPPRLRVAGRHDPSEAPLLRNPALEAAGVVHDLRPLYDRARVFLAPTRFAAGLPLKVMEAAAAGVPVVGTSLLAHQLGWRDDVEILVADTADDFAARAAAVYGDAALWSRLREAALARITDDCSPDSFRAALGRAFSALERRPASTAAPRVG